MKRHLYVNLYRLVIVLGIILCLIHELHAGNAKPVRLDADEQMKFADYLFENGQYRRAGEEFQRFAFFFAEHPKAHQALFKAGRAFYLTAEYTQALDQFKQLVSAAEISEIVIDAHFMIVECHLKMTAFTQALLHLHNLIAANDDISIRDKAYLRMGWIYIEQADWLRAEHCLKQVSASGQYQKHTMDKLRAAVTRATKDIPRKSPALAGTLSIVPGAGQLYCKRYQDALAAFVVNTTLIWAAIDAFDKEQYALGSLLSFVGFGFYSGNIYSAVSSAHKYNQFQEKQWIDQLKRDWTLSIGPAPQGTGKGIVLGLQLHF